jgi:ABC-type multidrug transport system permease subunit
VTNVYNVLASVCLAWRSITKYELITEGIEHTRDNLLDMYVMDITSKIKYSGPYTFPNAIQRFAVSILLLILVLLALGFDGIILTYAPIKGSCIY